MTSDPLGVHLAINGYFLDQPATGSGQYTLRLLEQLERLWPGEISVFVPRSHLIASSPHRLIPLDVPAPGSLGKVWFEQVAVPRAAASAGADLLHVPYFGAPVSPLVPVVVTVHDLIQLVVPRLRGGPRNRLYNLGAAVGARRAAALLADSEHSRRDILRRLRVPPERVHRVYLGTDPRFSHKGSPEEQDQVRIRFGLNDPFILYIGGLDWRKNVPLLIRAYARSGLTLPLALVGGAHSSRTASSHLQREAWRAGVTDRVKFLGWVDEEVKPALYRAAHLFVFPSLYEGFGLSPLEALASGTPTLCSNSTCLPEIMGAAAVPFDPQDEEGLANLLRQTAGDQELLKRLRKAGPEQARRFTWETTALETMAVYEQVVKHAMLH